MRQGLQNYPQHRRIKLSEVLMEVADQGAVRVEVKNIFKSKKGELVLKVGGDLGQADKLKREILNKTKALLTRTKQRWCRFFHFMNVVEIGGAISAKTELTKGDFEVKPVTQTSVGRGMNAVSVRIPRKAAHQQLEDKFLKLGWLRCRIQEKNPAPSLL